MKILLVNNHQFGGVEYYRALQPNNVLIKYNPEFKISSIPFIHPTDDVTSKEGTLIDDDFLQQFDLVHFLRQIGNFETVNGIVSRLNRLGIPFGLDLDDYWHLPENHLIYPSYIRDRTPECIITSIKESKFVTCSTEILADEIKKINKNVYIFSNGLDTDNPAWQPEYTTSEYMRFGFMLGSTHFWDLKKAAPSVNNLLRSNNKGYQIVLAGFNAELNKPSMYVGFERLLTDNHNLLSKGYSNYLKHCKKEGNELYINEKYVRKWGVDVEVWGYEYKDIDVSLVPLVDNKFNNCKSELKLIEAAFKGKGVICSNVAPYKGIATEDNSYLVNSQSDWYNQIKRALNNPNEVGDKIQAMRTQLVEKYSLKNLIELRKSVYLHEANK